MTFEKIDPAIIQLCISQFQLLTSPRATQGGGGDSHILFARHPGFFPKNFCPRDWDLDQVKFFQKLTKITVYISIFSHCFQEATENGRENACFPSQ